MLKYVGEEGFDPYVPKPGSPMVKGKAVGGPRDGINITAPQNWDGIVFPIQRGKKPITKPYPGRYKWQDKSWVWQASGTNEGKASTGRNKVHILGYSGTWELVD